MDFLTIEKKIVDTLKFTVWQNWHTESSREWTHIVRRSLMVLGHKLGYKVCTSGPIKQ